MRVFILASLSTDAIAGGAIPKAKTQDEHAQKDGSSFAVMLAATSASAPKTDEASGNDSKSEPAHTAKNSEETKTSDNSKTGDADSNPVATVAGDGKPDTKSAAKDKPANDNDGAATAQNAQPQIDASQSPLMQAQLAAQIQTVPQQAQPANDEDGDVPLAAPSAVAAAANNPLAAAGTQAAPGDQIAAAGQATGSQAAADQADTDSTDAGSQTAAPVAPAVADGAPKPAPAKSSAKPAPAPKNSVAQADASQNIAPGAKTAATSGSADGQGKAIQDNKQTADAAPQGAQPQAPQPQPAQQIQALSAPDALPVQPASVALNANVNTSLHIAPQGATPDGPNVNSMAVEIAARTQSGARLFEIRLDPPELGHVEVRLSIDAAGKAQAHMTADQPETLNLLQKDSSSLTQALRDAGLDVSDNGLNFSLRGQQGQNEQGQSGQGDSRRATFSAARVMDAAAPILSFNGAAADARLDIHV